MIRVGGFLFIFLMGFILFAFQHGAITLSFFYIWGCTVSKTELTQILLNLMSVCQCHSLNGKVNLMHLSIQTKNLYQNLLMLNIKTEPLIHCSIDHKMVWSSIWFWFFPVWIHLIFKGSLNFKVHPYNEMHTSFSMHHWT